jgi:hypothetical protein
MASSERATLRSLAVPVSTAGRLVATLRLGRLSPLCSDWISPDNAPAT